MIVWNTCNFQGNYPLTPLWKVFPHTCAKTHPQVQIWGQFPAFEVHKSRKGQHASFNTLAVSWTHFNKTPKIDAASLFLVDSRLADGVVRFDIPLALSTLLSAYVSDSLERSTREGAIFSEILVYVLKTHLCSPGRYHVWQCRKHFRKNFLVLCTRQWKGITY